MTMNLFLLIAILVVNFLTAYIIKTTIPTIFTKNPWLKYVLMVPPFALALGALIIFWDMISDIPKMTKDYFTK